MDAEIEDLLAGLSEDDDNLNVVGAADLPAAVGEVSASESYISTHTRIAKLFQQLQELYNQRLPILQERNLTAKQYVGLVGVLKNDADVAIKQLNTQLVQLLGRDHALALTIFLSTNRLVSLNMDTFATVERLVTELEALMHKYDVSVDQLAASASSTMPNVSSLIQPHVAAQLVIRVGGLRQLAVATPSNLVNPSTSVLVSDPLIAEVPSQHQRQALRILAAKLVLAARADSNNSDPKLLPETLLWKKNIEKRISQLLAPPPSLQHRSLPKPVDKKSSRRGGRKIRKRKEKRAQQIGEPEFVKFG